MGNEPAGVPAWLQPPLKTREIVMPHALARIVSKPRVATRRHALLRSGTALCAAVILAVALGAMRPASAQTLTPQQQLAVDIYKELVEINTVTDTGDTARAADAMAARVRAAGGARAGGAGVQPAPRRGDPVRRCD